VVVRYVFQNIKGAGVMFGVVRNWPRRMKVEGQVVGAGVMIVEERVVLMALLAGIMCGAISSKVRGLVALHTIGEPR